MSISLKPRPWVLVRRSSSRLWRVRGRTRQLRARWETSTHGLGLSEMDVHVPTSPNPNPKRCLLALTLRGRTRQLRAGWAEVAQCACEHLRRTRGAAVHPHLHHTS
eukprot:scaffold62526_cov42-Phaeocystis_antarctica.AAC.1